MRLIIVSGLSGAGKSVALHMLEDLGYYCIDNIPAALLKPFIAHTVRGSEKIYERTAVGLDARNTDAEIASVPTLVDELERSGIDCEVLFLVANDDELLRRFAETRRAHPLSRQGESLREAIATEHRLLEPVLNCADLVIDTSRMGVHGLRDLIYRRLDPRSKDRLSILVESFGFKHGIPGDADFVFDARSLPNPYWESALRPLTGRDAAVVQFLEEQTGVRIFIEDVEKFMHARIPEYRASARRYLTVAIGCTGGQHRSVYIAEQLATRFASSFPEVRLRHSGLAEASSPPPVARSVRPEHSS
ncbi:MAG: RNase adapter RapZ [Steroidobacteraceae bacterium]